MAYTCPICHKSFKKKRQILGHLIAKHKLRGEKLKEAYYKAIGKLIEKLHEGKIYKIYAVKEKGKIRRIVIVGNFDKDPQFEELAIYLKKLPQFRSSSLLARIRGIAVRKGQIKQIVVDLDHDGRPERIRIYGSDRIHRGSKTARVFAKDYKALIRNLMKEVDDIISASLREKIRKERIKKAKRRK